MFKARYMNKGPVYRWLRITVESFGFWTLLMGLLFGFDWAWPRGVVFGLFMGTFLTILWAVYDRRQFR